MFSVVSDVAQQIGLDTRDPLQVGVVLVVGIFLQVYGVKLLVGGGSGLARRFSIPPLKETPPPVPSFPTPSEATPPPDFPPIPPPKPLNLPTKALSTHTPHSPQSDLLKEQSPPNTPIDCTPKRSGCFSKKSEVRTSNSLRTSTCSGVGNWVISEELAGVKMIWKVAMRSKRVRDRRGGGRGWRRWIERA